jgi:hypothetical protein
MKLSKRLDYGSLLPKSVKKWYKQISFIPEEAIKAFQSSGTCQAAQNRSIH